MKYILLILFGLILWSGCLRSVKDLGIREDTVPVSGIHLVELSLGIKSISSLDLKSNLYFFGGDTIMISVVDKTNDGLFNQPKDIIVISDPRSKFVSVYPEYNSNVSYYREELLLRYRGKGFQVERVSADGELINIKYNEVSKYEFEEADAWFEDHLDSKLELTNLFSGKEESLGMISQNISDLNGYIYFHFWHTSCPPCFEEIPFISKLEEKGVLVINIALPKFDDRDRLMKTVDKFGYPGKHYLGNLSAVKEFGQNGFPFGVLVGSSDLRKLQIGLNAMEVYEFIFNEMK